MGCDHGLWTLWSGALVEDACGKVQGRAHGVLAPCLHEHTPGSWKLVEGHLIMYKLV